MSQSATSSAPVENPVSSTPAPDTRLNGRWLVVARVGWLVVVILTIALFVGSLPAYALSLQMPCLGPVACSVNGALSIAQIQGLQAAGFSLGDYAAYTIALTISIVLIWSSVGLLIFWRRSDDWLALLVALTLILFNTGAQDNAPTALALTSSAWTVPVDIVALLTEAAIILFFLLFPGGRFVPRWTRWAIALDLGLTAFSILPPANSSLNDNNWQLPIYGVGFIVLYLVMLFSQIYRYRRVSDPVQRQQTKWAVFGIVISAVCLVGLGVSAGIPALSQSELYAPVINTLYPVALLPIPLSIGIAILRYRLWDIDTLINRTLVYGLLTGILGTLYAGLIIGLQSLAGAITSKESHPVVIVISTLAIATLVLPVRRRIQSMIDRRFYRRKYDAEKTLAAFSASLRNEVDLAHLHEQVLAVVEETMQPERVSLWLRRPERDHPTALAYRLEPHSQVSTTPNPD